MAMSARGLVVAAAHSGAGKTTVTLGLLRAFARRHPKLQLRSEHIDEID